MNSGQLRLHAHQHTMSLVEALESIWRTTLPLAERRELARATTMAVAIAGTKKATRTPNNTEFFHIGSSQHDESSSSTQATRTSKDNVEFFHMTSSMQGLVQTDHDESSSTSHDKVVPCRKMQIKKSGWKQGRPPDTTTSTKGHASTTTSCLEMAHQCSCTRCFLS